MPKKVDFKRISFRPAREDDYQKIHDLSKDNMAAEIVKYLGGWDDKLFQKGFHSGDTTIIEYAGEFIGFYSWAESEHETGYIHNIQLRKIFQRQGIGRKALDLIESSAIKNDFKIIKLQAFRGSVAESFYKSNGYIPDKSDIGQSAKISLTKKIIF